MRTRIDYWLNETLRLETAKNILKNPKDCLKGRVDSILCYQTLFSGYRPKWPYFSIRARTGPLLSWTKSKRKYVFESRGLEFQKGLWINQIATEKSSNLPNLSKKKKTFSFIQTTTQNLLKVKEIVRDVHSCQLQTPNLNASVQQR